MGIKSIRLTALILGLCLLLTGCQFSGGLQKLMSSYGQSPHYSDMEYTRPDMDALQEAQDTCSQLANTGSAEDVMDAVYDFYHYYDSFYTNYVLADIRYSADLTDPYWQAEYDFCAENAPAAEAALEQLFCDLADSPLKEELEADDFFGADFFDDYQDEPVIDQKMLKLMEQEAVLESRYYELDSRYADADYQLDDALYGDMAQLLAELVAVRQNMAAYLGYRDYPTMAYELYYGRDYASHRAEAYMQQLAQALYDPYVALADAQVWDDTYGYSNETETFRYVKQAAEAMGGTPAEAFGLLETNGLYDIQYAPNKFDSSFEAYIWNYYSPFVFMNPYLDHTDKLTFAHEFGHFTADYACDGTYAGTDIGEIHSQTMEYLSLCYGKDTELLTRYKLADSLCTYMEQSAYALFEQSLYQLPPEELTEANIRRLYEDVGSRFGFDSTDWDTRDYVTVTHFYTEPMYVISYVVSNDLAMQFYQLELENPGEGLALYEKVLTCQDSDIIAFAREYGLEDPFSDTRLQAVAQLFAATEF